MRGTRTLRAVPGAPGILRNTAEHVIVLDYGTPEALEIIRARAHEFAAVLVEPVQSRRPDFQPIEFLKELREIVVAARKDLLLKTRSKIIERDVLERLQEAAQWLTVWLQSPELFSDWLDLRRGSAEFRKRFPMGR